MNKFYVEPSRKPLKDKIKAIYQKKKYLNPSSCNEESVNCNDEDERNITNNFKK